MCTNTFKYVKLSSSFPLSPSFARTRTEFKVCQDALVNEGWGTHPMPVRHLSLNSLIPDELRRFVAPHNYRLKSLLSCFAEKRSNDVLDFRFYYISHTIINRSGRRTFELQRKNFKLKHIYTGLCFRFD